MKSVKPLIISALFTALMIGGQLALSAVSGVEIVTILFLCFCYKFGIRQGLLVANAFSLIRCLIFGFYPNVITLYLIYYNAFAVVFGALGNLQKRNYSIKAHLIILFTAVIFTTCFTLLDNLITPTFYAYTTSARKAYFVASLYTLVPQLICVFATTLVLFPPIIKIIK